MAVKETTITETTTKKHRPSMTEIYEFLARFRGPGRITIHFSMGGHIEQLDATISKKEPSIPLSSQKA